MCSVGLGLFPEPFLASKGRVTILSHADNLEDWPKINMMQFSMEKCKGLHLDRNNINCTNVN